MNIQIELIEIEWSGPFSMEEIQKLDNGWDCGIYAIYGTHAVFGPDSLLYIGKTADNTFADRICWHKEEWIPWEPSTTMVYVGRLGGIEKMCESKWSQWDDMIDKAERLLIFYTTPPYNSMGKKNPNIGNTVLLINHKKRHRIPMSLTNYEWQSSISGANWTVFGKEAGNQG